MPNYNEGETIKLKKQADDTTYSEATYKEEIPAHFDTLSVKITKYQADRLNDSVDVTGHAQVKFFANKSGIKRICKI